MASRGQGPGLRCRLRHLSLQIALDKLIPVDQGRRGPGGAGVRARGLLTRGECNREGHRRNVSFHLNLIGFCNGPWPQGSRHIGPRPNGPVAPCAQAPWAVASWAHAPWAMAWGPLGSGLLGPSPMGPGAPCSQLQDILGDLKVGGGPSQGGFITARGFIKRSSCLPLNKNCIC